MSVRWLLWSLLSPSQLLLMMPVLGALLLLLGRVRAGRVLCVSGGVAILLLGFLPLSHYLVHLLEARFPQPVLPPRITGIVLLSGAERPAASLVYQEPQLNLAAARYTATLRLAAQHPEARVVFSGGPLDDVDLGHLGGQTAVAKEILLNVGLDPARLTFEEMSRDTCDNATNTRALVRPQPGETWVVVTSAMHVPRAIACFRAVGWNVVPKPADYHVVLGLWRTGSFEAADNLALMDSALHEWIGLVYYRLSGRTKELFPSAAPSWERAGSVALENLTRQTPPPKLRPP